MVRNQNMCGIAEAAYIPTGIKPNMNSTSEHTSFQLSMELSMSRGNDFWAR